MDFLLKKLQMLHMDTEMVLDSTIPKSSYYPIDLSIENRELNNYDVQNPTQCQNYISSVLSENDSSVAFGGYLEKRNL